MHHIIPRADGGMPTSDNLVWLCPFCHDEIEDEDYNWRAFWERAKELQAKYIPQPKVVILYQNRVIPSRWQELILKRRDQGFLSPDESKEYQKYWMDSEVWKTLWEGDSDGHLRALKSLAEKRSKDINWRLDAGVSKPAESKKVDEITTRTTQNVGRPKKFKSNAEKQRAYRNRKTNGVTK